MREVESLRTVSCTAAWQTYYLFSGDRKYEVNRMESSSLKI